MISILLPGSILKHKQHLMILGCTTCTAFVASGLQMKKSMAEFLGFLLLGLLVHGLQIDLDAVTQSTYEKAKG